MVQTNPLTLDQLLSDLSQVKANPHLLPISPSPSPSSSSSSPPATQDPPGPLPQACPQVPAEAVTLAQTFLDQSDRVLARADGVELLLTRIADVEREAVVVQSGLE
ncbi:hypothetical protein T439DRAFT_353056 [Meredithblackwellia eburnea MCA 4105]